MKMLARRAERGSLGLRGGGRGKAEARPPPRGSGREKPPSRASSGAGGSNSARRRPRRPCSSRSSNTETVYAQADVAEKDLASVRLGQDAEIRAGELPPRKGTVRLLSPYLNPQTKSAQVKVLLDNRDGRLVPGMFARVTIRPRALPGPFPWSPESALVAEEGGKYSVFALRGGALFKLPVSPGQGRRQGRGERGPSRKARGSWRSPRGPTGTA